MARCPAFLALASALLLHRIAAQGTSEQHSTEQGPEINLRKCTAPGQCTTSKLKLTIDANWRWVHNAGGYKNCYKGNQWIEEFCPSGDGAACAQKCVLEGVDANGYKTTYGVEAIPNGVSMKFVNKHEYGISVGSRLYMYDNDKYEMFMLMNAEFAFDADMKELECGMNGAVYFIEMQANGGKGIGNNQAGAKFGTGYCDAQCPHDIKFIDGEANIKGWKPNPKDKSGNMGTGHYGACCNEMDIWEANARSNAYTPHPCIKPSMYRCEGKECGDNDKGERYKGVCDKDGCDFASWRVGNRKFYGKGSEFEIDTGKKLTQVTQFLTKDGSASGDLAEIRRIWTQGGKTVKNTEAPHLKGCMGEGDSLTDDFCTSQNEKFGDYNHFKELGGLKEMGESLKRGHVLAISLWDDVDVSMMWLDSWFPRNKDKNEPGVSRGPCKGGEPSTPTSVRQKYPDAKVYYTNFAVGALGSTTPGVEAGPPAKKPKEYKKCAFTPSHRRRRGEPPSQPDRPDDKPTRRRKGGTRRRRSETRRRTKTRRRGTTRRRTKTRRRTTTRRRSTRRRSS